jgi:hypothetical protein
MGKPVVRIVLDKDTLPKLLPDGDLDAQIALDNSVIQLIKESATRLIKKNFLSGLEEDFNKAISSVYQYSWRKTDDLKVLVQKAVESFAIDLIDKYYRSTVEDVTKRIKKIEEERLAIVEKLIAQMTSPEEIEKLMVKACAGIVKGNLK